MRVVAYILISVALAILLAVATIMVCFWPQDAHAEFFIYGNELGLTDVGVTDAASPFSGICTTAPSDETTVPGDQFNHFALYYSYAFGSSVKCLKYTGNLSDEPQICALSYFYYTDNGNGSLPNRTIMEFVDTTGPTLGAFIAIEGQTLGSATTLKTWYEDYGTECVTSTNNGTECTTVADCEEANENEALCASSHYASIPVEANTWYIIGLEQDNTAGEGGDVKVTTYFGEPGAVRAVNSRTKPQGACTVTGDPEDDGWACASNTDCTVDSTCDVSDVVNIDQVNFGSSKTAAATETDADYYLDNLVVVNSSCSDAMLNYRIIDLWPRASPNQHCDDFTTCVAATDWGEAASCGVNHTLCLDQPINGSGPNDQSIDNDVATYDDLYERLGFTDPDWTDTCTASVCVDSLLPCPGGQGECMAASPNITGVAAYGYMADVNNSSGDGQLITQFTCSDNADCDESPGKISDIFAATTTGFRVAGYHSSQTNQLPPAGAWSAADVTAIEVKLNWDDLVEPCTTCDLQISEYVVEAMVELPQVATPGILSDWSGDGLITVAYIGDSRLNTPIELGLLDDIADADNILDCARGGATIGDTDANTTSSGLLYGQDAGYQGCEARKGSTGAQVDLAVLSIGINSVRGMNAAPPNQWIGCDNNTDCYAGDTCPFVACSGSVCQSAGSAVCSVNSDCAMCSGPANGYCFDNGGADEGASCYCPKNSWWLSDDSVADRYCVNPYDIAFKDPCTTGDDCVCVTAATDCAAGQTCAAGGTCNVAKCCSRSVAGPGTQNYCWANNSRPTENCLPGCLGADGCEDGVCASGNSVAENARGYNDVIDKFLAASEWDLPPHIVLVLEPMATPTDWPHVDEDLGFGCWGFANEGMGALNSHLWNRYITDGGINVHIINLQDYFYECCGRNDVAKNDIANCYTPLVRCVAGFCDGGDESACTTNTDCTTANVKDGVHVNSVSGAACWSDPIIDCLTQPDSLSSDGNCASGVCTAGLVGDGADPCKGCIGGPKDGTRCATNAECTQCSGLANACATNTNCIGAETCGLGAGVSCADDDRLCNTFDCVFGESSPVAMPSMTNQLWSLWTFDGEATDGDAIDSATGGLTTDSLTDNGTTSTARSSVTKQQGTDSVTAPSLASRQLECFNCRAATSPSKDTNFIGCPVLQSLRPNETSCPGGGNFAWGGWIYPTSTNNVQMIIDNQDTSLTGYYLGYNGSSSNQYVYCRAGGKMQVGGTTIASNFINGKTPTTCSGPTCTPLSQWSHVVCVWDPNDAEGNELRMYVNGVSVGSASLDYWSAPLASTQNFRFFNNATGGQRFTGFLDEFFVVHNPNSPMTAADVNNIGACGADGALCSCDSTDSSAFFACTTNDDCLGEAICDQTPTPHRCKGRSEFLTAAMGGCSAGL